MAIAAVLAVTGCSDGGGGTQETTALASPDYSVESPLPDDEMAVAAWEVSGRGAPARSPLHEMWTEYLRDSSSAPAPPRAVIPYAPGEVPPIACGGQLPASDWIDNAFYCPADQTIVYDEAFVRAFHDRIGESATESIIAHEWGHHIQHVLGEAAFSIQNELQADCFAGMFASHRDIQSDDVTASVVSARAFYELGNKEYSNSAWFSSGEHGSPRQRLVAWALGYQSVELGLQACRGYSEWAPGRTAAIGPYTLVVLPGRPGELRETGEYVLADEELPPVEIARVDVSTSEAASPGDLLRAWLEARFGDRLAALDGPHHSERPDEVAFYYYAVDSGVGDDAGAFHGIFGLQLSPADPGYALVYSVPAPGSPPAAEEEPSPESTRGVLEAFQMALMVADRVCAPHHTTDDGQPDTHNEMCYPDL